MNVKADAEARAKLAVYVHEYLVDIGAQKLAEAFHLEVTHGKHISLRESSGFLQSWWCVFWDLYCAAPEQRDTCEYSFEAKAFHDYGFVNSGIPGTAQYHTGPAPSFQEQAPSRFSSNSPMRTYPSGHSPNQPSPHSQPPLPYWQMLSSHRFVGSRYPDGPSMGVKMPPQLAQNDFNGPPITLNSTQGQGEDVEFVSWQDLPKRKPLKNRCMSPPRDPSMDPLTFKSFASNISLGPGGPIPPMPTTGLGGPPQRQPMTYSSPSPGNYSSTSAEPPTSGTPTTSSPQHPSKFDGDKIYTLMKPVVGANTSGKFPMGSGPEKLLNGDEIEAIRNLLANGGPGTAQEGGTRGADHFNCDDLVKILGSLQE